MKQETLEEAAVIAAGLCEHLEAREQAFFIAGFQECIKWQQERMYSEEDMRLSFETGRNFQLTGEDNFNELIEQFKNK